MYAVELIRGPELGNEGRKNASNQLKSIVIGWSPVSRSLREPFDYEIHHGRRNSARFRERRDSPRERRRRITRHWRHLIDYCQIWHRHTCFSTVTVISSTTRVRIDGERIGCSASHLTVPNNLPLHGLSPRLKSPPKRTSGGIHSRKSAEHNRILPYEDTVH